MKKVIESIFEPFVALVIALSMVATPALVLAKDNGHNDNNGKKSNPIAQIQKIQQQKDLQIRNDGTITLQGATVTGVGSASTTITTAFTWGGTTMSFTVKTDSNTRITQKNGNKITLADVAVGDVVNIAGTLDASAAFTINAKTLRDVTREKSIPLTNDIFQGTLQSISSTTTLPTTFSLLLGGITRTVTVASSTVVLKSNWTLTTLGQFVIGDIIRVFGSVQSNGTTIDALVVRNATR
ncbi:MAG: hypothetical protein A2664_01400 [Candidatus Taylorbacteria bacterium RIFCSPHIGHO2_01_FULL_46_22b]|uniref:DUF5666 domain-containing protein n=1 Tax=Candidatus Taylorbacteria bacterium RIFCSPHIGHO2_01_FULL_46_22b TaxID=1802301 RepID=A0A1G2M263_9BACT|nr:MAG: hypothetical protein A2664_01400 [Candidatus Taylorbacteria bacterium RIFCSPHIGHO2_01_FULL_46_22b]